jgi:hypothetical protein
VHQNERAVWKDYNERQTFEHELINRTTTWMLTTQTLLFAGYGITFTAECTEPKCIEDLDRLRDVVAVSGLVIAALLFLGVGCLINSKWMSWRQYRRYFEQENPPNQLPGPLKGSLLPWGVRTWNTWISVGIDLVLPLVFVVAWWVLSSAA